MSLFVSLSGCTEDANYNGNTNTEVISISSNDDAIEDGSETVFYFDFDFDENAVFFDEGEVQLVVKLPRELSFVRDSAVINAAGSDNYEVAPYVLQCTDGSSFLAFSLDSGDLDNASSPSDAEAQLKMTLQGRRPGIYSVVQATASADYFSFGCTKQFNPDTFYSVVVY